MTETSLFFSINIYVLCAPFEWVQQRAAAWGNGKEDTLSLENVLVLGAAFCLCNKRSVHSFTESHFTQRASYLTQSWA